MTAPTEALPRLIFVGGGRLAGLLYATCHREYEVLGYVDDVNAEAYLTTTYGVPCLGTSEALPNLKTGGVAAVVAITDAAARKRYGELLDSLDFPLATLVFPTAVVDGHATVGPGCIIRHQAVVGPQVRLGRNCVVSDNAYVAHDSVVGAHTYISPGVNINGSVTIGEASFLGTGAVIIPELRIGDGCMVGAAACVTKDVADGQTVVGVPARPVAGGGAAANTAGPAAAAGGAAAMTAADAAVGPTVTAAATPAAATVATASDPAPLVSVLMASYNHEQFVREAILSALEQTLEDIELIIVDDASTDGSVAVIEQFTDPRVRFVRHERNRGIGPTKNEVFQMARGRYVAILNSDDSWLPDKLEKQVAVFSEDPGLGAVFTGAQVIDENGRPFAQKDHFYYSIFDQPNRTRPEWLSYFFHQGNCLCAPSVLLPRERTIEIGYYDKRLRQLGDMDLWVRICMRHPIHVMPERLTRFRVLKGEANTSGRTTQTQIGGRFEYSRILRHYLQIPDEAELLAILPEAERFIDPAAPLDAPGIAYAVAMLALDRPGRYRQLFALETLFELMADDGTAAYLEQRFAFGYKELTDLAGRLDVFGLTGAPSVTKRLQRRIGARLQRRRG